jgi:predicted peptidase
MLDEGSDLGVILLVPQCPPDGWWENEIPGLVGLLEQVAAEYRVDPERVYLTGLSMGGYGSWAVAGAIADRIAALVPVCGGGTLWQARSVARAGVPVWMFHGDADTVVPLEESTRMIRLLERWGGKGARLTVFPSTGHDSWTAAYRDPELWRWMLSQRRGARPRE